MTKSMNKLDLKNIPQHVAIIMDGNRRWAKKQNLPTLKGHAQGIVSLEKVVEKCIQLGVKYLTVYALSTENIQERSPREVFGLFRILQQGYSTKIKKLMQNGVKVKVLGFEEGLPSQILKIIQEASNIQIDKPVMQLNIALNYGGRKEILSAVKNIINQKIPSNKINENLITDNLLTNGIPDPDLIIRTGGKVRISNFLIWQAVYAEWYFTEVLWPDFGEQDLKKALVWYQSQKRNFGK